MCVRVCVYVGGEEGGGSHDALPRRAEEDVGEGLDDQRGRFGAAALVLPLAEAAQVQQQVAQRQPVVFG